MYLALPVFFTSGYQFRVLDLMVIFTLFTVANNMILGHTKQLFLCQGALAGVGAYTAILISLQYGISPWLLFPLGALASGAIGAALSFVSAIRKLTILYVAVLTLSFQLIFQQITTGVPEFTRGGGEGFSLPPLDIHFIQTTLNLSARYTQYYILVFILLLALLLYNTIIRSSVGIAFKAISQEETTAEFVGINVAKYKAFAAFVGSSILGFVGGIYAYYNTYISPSIFSTSSVDTLVLVMLVFGGMGTLLGPLLGAAIFSLVNQLLLPLGPLSSLVFGALLAFLFLYFREGMIPWLAKFKGKTTK